MEMICRNCQVISHHAISTVEPMIRCPTCGLGDGHNLFDM